MLKQFLVLSVMFLGACAQKHVITNVNQLPLYSPSHLSYAARDGALPFEVHGALPSGISPEQLAAAVHLPGEFPKTRLVLSSQAPNENRPVDVSASNPYGSLCLQRVLDSGVAKNGYSCRGPFRLVLIFNPDIRTPPDMACDAPGSIITAGGQNVRVLAALCIGNRLASSGQVRAPALTDGAGNISGAINVLLMDMLQPRPRGGQEPDHRRL